MIKILKKILEGHKIRMVKILEPITDVKILFVTEDDSIVLCCNECGIWIEKLCPKCSNYMSLRIENMEWECYNCNYKERVKIV